MGRDGQTRPNFPGARPASEQQGRRLDSWKEIAAYLGRSEKTVRRWEEKEELPVHRLLHEKRGSVYAYSSELDAWREARQAAPESSTVNGRCPAIVEIPKSQVKAESLARRARLPLIGLSVLLIAIAIGWFARRRIRTQSGTATGERIHSLAVLPLENLSGDSDQEYFADGMTDELITELAKISALRVISRTSVMQYRGEKKPLPEIARQLNVDAVVEGTLLRAGDRVRITAQLIRVVPERHLWSESYERDLRNILDLQREVARAIASEIQINLTSRERAELLNARPVDPVAHETYLRGIYFWNKRTEQDLQKSIEYFSRAVQRDPKYALAYAGLANAYNSLGVYAHLPPRKIY